MSAVRPPCQGRQTVQGEREERWQDGKAGQVRAVQVGAEGQACGSNTVAPQQAAQPSSRRPLSNEPPLPRVHLPSHTHLPARPTAPKPAMRRVAHISIPATSAQQQGRGPGVSSPRSCCVWLVLSWADRSQACQTASLHAPCLSPTHGQQGAGGKEEALAQHGRHLAPRGRPCQVSNAARSRRGRRG